MTPIAIVILAAGSGTRMKSPRPKVLHEIGGAPLLHHVFLTARQLNPERLLVVTGEHTESIKERMCKFGPLPEFVRQNKPLGTGHAVAAVRNQLTNFTGNAIILYGDAPFIRNDTLKELVTLRENADLAILGFETKNPSAYGRLVLDEGGELAKIVELKDATDDEKQITFCNSGVVSTSTELLFELLEQVKPNPITEEYYLTDIVAIARGRGLRCHVKSCNEQETVGINSPAELSAAEALFQENSRRDAMDTGATLLAPDTIYFSHDTELAPGCIIEPYVIFGNQVKVESEARICSFSHLCGCSIESGATIGPFARIRPNSTVGRGGKVGNFVELKEVVLEHQAKANHLSYLGNTRIGENTNIGAGTITCNYDGKTKHQTDIGKDTFIGSNSILIAPVEIGDSAMTAAGSTITSDVPCGALGVGRARQSIIKGFVARFFGNLKTSKE